MQINLKSKTCTLATCRLAQPKQAEISKISNRLMAIDALRAIGQ
ncbi:hypothetical protein QUA01_15760 [Microcoleus sp. S36a_B3]